MIQRSESTSHRTQMLWLLPLLLLSVYGNSTEWQSALGQLSQRSSAFRSQRDISANVSISQVTMGCVSLSKAFFQEDGYVTELLQDIQQTLVAGLQTLVVDLYWNEGLRKFQLCPVPFANDPDYFTNTTVTYYEQDGTSVKCQVGLSLNVLLNAVEEYLMASDTNLNGNIVALLFNLHSIGMGRPYDDSLIGNVNDTLSVVASNTFGPKLYTPDLLRNDRAAGVTVSSIGPDSNGYPPLQYFLFEEKRRILGAVWQNNLPSNTSYDLNSDSSTIFNSSYFKSFSPFEDVTISNFTKQAMSSWRFMYDSQDEWFTVDTLAEAVHNGYSPLLNHSAPDSNDFLTLYNVSLWSWAPNQPLAEADARQLASETDSSLSQAAFRCAVLNHEAQWVVSNCYDGYLIACQGLELFDWQITNTSYSYFDASDACAQLEGNYTFGVPHTALEQRFLTDSMVQQNLNDSIWIDMNSVAVSDCWVSGGPYASCPYQKVSSPRNFAHMIAPASAVVLILILMMFLLRFRKVPVQKNRKQWRRIEREKTEGEFEGVPS